MKTSKEMVKLDENNEATNKKMPKTNFMAKVIFKKENQNVFFHALYLGKGSTSLLLYLFKHNNFVRLHYKKKVNMRPLHL